MRRLDPTIIGCSLLLLLAAGVVAAFLFISQLVAQNDPPITPYSPFATATPVYAYLVYLPTPQPTSTLPSLGPTPSVVSQTLDGITVSVQTRYADLNRLIFTYTVAGPTLPYPYFIATNSLDNRPPSLTLDDGTVLPQTSLSPDTDTFEFGWQSHPIGETTPQFGYLVFDTSLLGSLPDTLTMHLTLPTMLDYSPYFTPYPSPIPTAPPGVYYTPTPIPSPSPIPPPNKPITFTFDLATTLDKQCRLMDIPRPAYGNNVLMTLNYVLITATEARFNMSYTGTLIDGTSTNTNDWTTTASLTTGVSSVSSMPIQLWSDCSFGNCGPFPGFRGGYPGFRYSGQSLMDAPTTDWILLVNDTYSGSRPPGYSSTNTWTFKFDMPAKTACTEIPSPVSTALPTTQPTP